MKSKRASTDLGAYTDNNFNLTGQGEPERISCAQVTASVFTTLGVQPVKGRLFLPQEDAVGANNVAIVSENFWQRRYGVDEVDPRQDVSRWTTNLTRLSA